MGADLAHSVFPGISGRRKRDVEEQLRRNIPDYSHRHYLPRLHVYRPGVETNYRPRRDYPVYEKTEFVVRKRSLTDELQDNKTQIEAELADMHNHIQNFVRPSSTTPAPHAPNQTQLLPLDELRQDLGKKVSLNPY